MPRLSELTDYDPMGSYTGGIAPEAIPAEPEQPSKTSSTINNILNKLFRDDDQRYQLWPEKVVREALSAAGDVYKEGTVQPGLRREDITDIPAPDMPTKDSTWLGQKLGIAPVSASPVDPIVEKAQAMSALAGTGGLAGTTDATLGATPFLRPALKYKDRLYKGKEGQQHMDVIPDNLYPEFQKMAMNGEDISHYKFGFVNDKGQFLDREKALEYGINTGLVDPQAGKFGALTSTLMADSSKPGTAIEALAKTGQDAFHGTPTPGFTRFNKPDPGQYMPDRALGVHVSKDPEIANTFVKDNGAVYPLKIPEDAKFFDVKQDLLPYIKDKNEPKHARNVISDQNAIETAIYKVAYKKDPEMFARFLEARWNMPKADAEAAAKNVLSGVPQKFMGRPVKGLDDYIQHDGVVKAWNDIDRAKATEIFKKDLQDKGYAGVKYINTSPMETANAKDHTSYIVFDPSKHIQSKYTQTLMSDSSKPGSAIQAMKNWTVKGHENSDWYHGSVRSDRVVESGKIEPKRATSGPMPYFTDDPEMASAYAMGKKPDTSLIKSDTGDSVANYFTVAPKDLGYSRAKTPMTVEQSYWHLPKEKQKEILDKYHKIGYENRETGEGPYTLHKEDYSGLSGKDHYDYILKHEAKGNPLAALRMIWHDGGSLIGSESDLASIYKLAGYPHNISEKTAPWVEARGVVPVKLKMNNPLKTDNKEEIINKVIPHLEEVFKNDRSRLKTNAADLWDKEARWTPKEWLKQLKEDTDKGIPGYTWTSIPDKVTAALKQLGYDGIVDTGGKMGGQGHNVAIPFEPHQVRSRFAKFNPEDAGKSGLLLSDTSQPGVALQAIQKAQPFYSALEHNISKIPQSKMTGEQWLGTLSNKPGVKPEELDWTGVKSFLEENKGKPVTKAELEQHMAANKIELKEVNHGDVNYNNTAPDKIATEKYQKQWDEAVLEKNQIQNLADKARRDYDNGRPVDPEGVKAHMREKALTKKLDDLHEKMVRETLERLGGEQKPPKYSSWQLPGGENYREKLLTLPDKGAPVFAKIQENSDMITDLRNSMRGTSGTNEIRQEISRLQIQNDILKAKLKENPAYKSSHWDEPNILAHVRMNDRQFPTEYTAEQKAALAAHENRTANLETNRKEQIEAGKDIRFKARSLEFDRNAKIQEDLKAGKITHLEALKKIEEPVEHPELKELQDKLVALRKEEDALRKSLPEKPTQQNLKSLHLEEIQSDWHQQGRDRGYRVNQDKEMAELVKQRDALPKPYNELSEKLYDHHNIRGMLNAVKTIEDVELASKHNAYFREAVKGYPPEYVLKAAKEAESVVAPRQAIQDKIDELGRKDTGVPDAPFKKTWHELALKRMIREAAEKGYDRLSWTPGEAQAARYDLSKQIKELYYQPQNEKLVALDHNGRHVMEEYNVKPEKLPDYVGKDVAKKLLETEYDPKNPYAQHILKDQDIKIGGEGMKGFYDQIIPKALEKIGKEHGVKVKTENLHKEDASKKYYEFLDDMRDKVHAEIQNDYIKETGMDKAKAEALADKFVLKAEPHQLAKYLKKETELDQLYRAKLEFDKVGHQPIHYIDIPQSLRDAAMNKGFPLFSSTHMFTPVQGNPFDASKEK